MKRLSYNWFHETLSTMLTTIIIVTLSVTIFDYFREYYSDGLLTQILKTNLIVTPIITVFWGLQPVINSGRIPKTLYENGNGELYLNKNFRLDFNEIDKVVVVHISAAEMRDHYYKILFKTKENEPVESTSRPIYLAEKYSLITFFTHFLKPKLDVIDHLKKSGLNPEKITEGEAPPNFFFWRRKK